MLITNHLHIYINKSHLNYLINSAKNNFFNYVYNTSPYTFYREEKGFIFKLKMLFFGKLKKLSYDEAQTIYNKVGFARTLSSLNDHRYVDLFTNYEIICLMDNRELIPIYVEDFKKFLQIADLSYSDFFIFSQKLTNDKDK